MSLLCEACREKVITAFKPPYGGYICPKQHFQCVECNTSGFTCKICGEKTQFLQFTLVKNESTSEISETGFLKAKGSKNLPENLNENLDDLPQIIMKDEDFSRVVQSMSLSESEVRPSYESTHLITLMPIGDSLASERLEMKDNYLKFDKSPNSKNIFNTTISAPLIRNTTTQTLDPIYDSAKTPQNQLSADTITMPKSKDTAIFNDETAEANEKVADQTTNSIEEDAAHIREKRSTIESKFFKRVPIVLMPLEDLLKDNFNESTILQAVLKALKSQEEENQLQTIDTDSSGESKKPEFKDKTTNTTGSVGQECKDACTGTSATMFEMNSLETETNFTVMPVTTNNTLYQFDETVFPPPFKKDEDNIDERYGKLLRTFQEETHPPLPLSEGGQEPLSLANKNVNRLNKLPALIETNQSKQPEDEETVKAELKEALAAERKIAEASLKNAFKESFERPVADIASNPSRQSALVGILSDQKYADLKEPEDDKEKSVPDAYAVLLNRAPLRCPESGCESSLFVSDFCQHLVYDHNNVPLERILIAQEKIFFCEVRSLTRNISRCIMCYFLRNAIKNIGSTDFKDYIPVMIMATRVRPSEVYQFSAELPEEEDPTNDFYFFWVTGLVPEKRPIRYDLHFWPLSWEDSEVHLGCSNFVYSLRDSQKPYDVWSMGAGILLHPIEAEKLSKDFQEVVVLKISIF